MTCMFLAIWVLGLVETALASVPTAVHLQCPASRTTAMKFSILSSRNQTGHWNCEVVLGHSAMQPDTSSGPWEIDVEQSTQHCAQGGETVLITAVLTVPPQVGLPGYRLLPGHGYYRVHRIPATWDEARRTCVEEGAQLLVVNSQAEAAAVRDSLLGNLVIEGTSDNSYLHAGFHDLFAEGQFVTVTGEPLSSSGYLTWSWNEPNNDGNEDCGSINRNMALNDVLCSKRLYFICEQGL